MSSSFLSHTTRGTTPFVKVCGLRSLEDIEAAVEAGADAVGFVHWEPSVRHLSLLAIRRLAVESPITTVLVTVDLDSAELVDAAARAGVDVVQPHGANNGVASAAARRAGFEVIHPIKAGDAAPAISNGDLLLVDTPGPGPEGGRGVAFDWQLTTEIDRPFLLAGGLGPDNVGDAVEQVKPFGVDASSGLESAPGVKDATLIHRFVRSAKEAHRS